MFQTNHKNKILGSIAAAMVAVPLMMAQQPQQPQYPPPQQGDPGQYQQQPQYPPQGQPAYAQPVNYSPQQLDQIVSKIALYPDPLLAQIFAAATFPEQIQDAAAWADQHHYLTGPQLASAIQADHVPFDPSVQALLPFPSVLDMMAGDMEWTAALGNAFLSQGPMLQDAVQRMRHIASNNGYLRTGGPIVVDNGPYITINPVDPGYIVVPYYNPALIYYSPWRPGLSLGISFGYGVSIGTYFAPWGWGGAHFGWSNHAVYINNAVWGRRWDNRMTYVHPYVGVERRGFAGGMERGNMRPGDVRPGEVRPEVGRGPAGGAYQRAAEQHQLEGRSPVERRAEQQGRPAPRESHSAGRGSEEHRH
jgi:hypothetical protein